MKSIEFYNFINNYDGILMTETNPELLFQALSWSRKIRLFKRKASGGVAVLISEKVQGRVSLRGFVKFKKSKNPRKTWIDQTPPRPTHPLPSDFVIFLTWQNPLLTTHTTIPFGWNLKAATTKDTWFYA